MADPKLSGHQVRKAREMYWFDGVAAQRVATLFGLSESSMNRLLTGETYKWAEGPKSAQDTHKYTPPKPVVDPTTKRLRRRMYTDKRTLQLRPPYRVVNTVLFETWEDINEIDG